MEALCVLYEAMGLEGAQTYVQSGNVIFWTKEKNAETLTGKIRKGIDKTFGFNPAVVLRSLEEMRAVVKANPFAARKEIEPGKLLVTFLAGEPAAGAEKKLSALKGFPEELHLRGRELFIYFPNGAGRSKLPWSQVDKLVGVTGTARNWNSVTKMLEIAEKVDNANLAT